MASVNPASADGSSAPASRRLPKIEALPPVRPKCMRCGTPLKFWTNETREGRPSRVVRRVFTNWRGYPVVDPVFCTLRCALAFAVAAVNAGYTIRRSK
jgi:hypothetical protein